MVRVLFLNTNVYNVLIEAACPSKQFDLTVESVEGLLTPETLAQIGLESEAVLRTINFLSKMDKEVIPYNYPLSNTDIDFTIADTLQQLQQGGVLNAYMPAPGDLILWVEERTQRATHYYFEESKDSMVNILNAMKRFHGFASLAQTGLYESVLRAV